MSRIMEPRRVPRWVRRAGRIAIDRDARADALREWQRRWRGEPELPDGEIQTVTVVCHGNICRSPFAAALLEQEHGGLTVRSAGFAATAGKPAEPSAVRAAARFGVPLEAHVARRLSAEDVAWADLVLAMEGHHVARIPADRATARKVHLLGDFLPVPPFALEDPWGRSDEVFDAVFARIALAVRRLAARIGKPR
jgi:low molecular weight protein-tyrosine phosphatase